MGFPLRGITRRVTNPRGGFKNINLLSGFNLCYSKNIKMTDIQEKIQDLRVRFRIIADCL